MNEEIKVVNESGEESKPVEPKSPDTILVGKDEILHNAVAQAFDLRPKEMGKYSQKINTILAYAKMQTESHSPANIKWAIRNLEMKLGTPPISENRISYVSRYAYLALEKAKIEGEMETYNPFGEK